MQAILSEKEYAEYLQLKQASKTRNSNVDAAVADALRRIAGMIPRKSFMASEDFISVIENAANVCKGRLQPDSGEPTIATKSQGGAA